MSEIEKMYENANIKAKEYCDRDSDACMACCPEWENRQDCWKYKSVIPTFTAEKQLKLIVFFVRKGFKVSFDNYTKDFSLEGIQKSLAMAINDKWQSLTEEEKQQIKDILK